MARTKSPERLDAITSGALAIFGALGYRRARMSDVAAAAGVSAGLLYTYAESKEALFALVLRRAAGLPVAELDLPVATPSRSELRALVADAFTRLAPRPDLVAAVAGEAPDDVAAEVRAIVAEQFTMVEQHRELLRLVERCAVDWPDLATSFYDEARRAHLETLEEYLTARMDAGCLPRRDPRITARFVMETVAWFAGHRFDDHDGAALDDDTVRTEVTRLVTDALTAR